MATSAQLIDAIARAVKDPSFQKRSSSIYAQILTDAQDYLTDQLEPLIKIDESVVMVAGTGTYNMPADFVKFETRSSNMQRGYVVLGDDRDVPLLPVTQGQLDTYRPKWKATSDATPSHYYIDMVGGANASLGIWPPPNSTYISNFGTKCSIRYVYRMPALAYDSSYPFDGTINRFRGLNYLLKLHAIWQISLEDMDVAKADRYDIMVEKRMEQAKDEIESVHVMPSAVGFTPYGKNIL
jgi:hypothetical protein